MAERVVLHIGAPKSGTTFLQTTLWGNRARLLEEGVLLPGLRKRNHDTMAFAVHGERGTARRQRDELLAEIRDWHGTALLSSEWFCLASTRQVGRFLEQLAPARVDVVFTARRFVAAVPAAWSQTLKSGKYSELEDFVRNMDYADPYWNWGTTDPAVALEQWRRHLPVEQVHVVTVPPPGAPRDELWRRFATACRIEAAGQFDLDVAKANESLSAEACRLLQLVGPHMRSALRVEDSDKPLARWWIRSYYSQELLLGQPGHPIKVDQAEIDLLSERAERSVTTLREAGYDVIGDLQDLLDRTVRPDAVRPRDVDDAELFQLAATTLPPMLTRIWEEFHRANRAETRLRRLRERTQAQREAAAGPAADGAAPDAPGARRQSAGRARVRLDRPTLPDPVVREARRRFGPTKRRLLRRADDLWHRRGDT